MPSWVPKTASLKARVRQMPATLPDAAGGYQQIPARIRESALPGGRELRRKRKGEPVAVRPVEWPKQLPTRLPVEVYRAPSPVSQNGRPGQESDKSDFARPTRSGRWTLKRHRSDGSSRRRPMLDS